MVFYTQVFFSHTRTRVIFRRDALKHRCFYAGILVHRDAFSKRCFHTKKRFYTQILLHRDDFALRNFTRRCHNKRSRFYKGMHLHEELLHTDDFTQAYFHLISERQTCISRQEFSKPMQNRNFTTALMIETRFVKKGGSSTIKITISPFFQRSTRI